MTHLALMVLCALGFLFGVTGNGFILFISGYQKKTVNFIWHLNVAAAGFIFASFLPLTIAQLVMGFHGYMRTILCNINNFATSLCMFFSSFHLTAMSADCCISVVYPMWAKNYRTVRWASLVTWGIWILAGTASWRYYGRCSDQSFLLRESGEVASVATQFLVGFLVPLVLLSICLVSLAAKLGWNQMTWSKKRLQTLLVLHIIFVLCWFPYHVISFLQTLYKASSGDTTKFLESGTIFAHVLLCFNSCFYPSFYFIKRYFASHKRQKKNHQITVNVGSEVIEMGGNE